MEKSHYCHVHSKLLGEPFGGHPKEQDEFHYSLSQQIFVKFDLKTTKFYNTP